MVSLFCGSKGLLRREAILQVAREVFCEEGYAATSMSSISARLGGSKATLYKYFRSKEELFAASLEDLISSHAIQPMVPAATGEDFQQTLAAVCRAISTSMLSPPLMSLFRLVVAESPRFPEIGEAYYEKVIAPWLRRLADYMQHCIDQRLLRRVDPGLAASQLYALCRGNNCFRALANLRPTPTDAEIAAEADLAAATFIAAFGMPHG